MRTCEVEPGISIEEACRQAMDNAEVLGEDVQFVFNDIPVVVRFEHTPRGLATKYLEDLASGSSRSRCPNCCSAEIIGTPVCANCHAKLIWRPSIRL